MHAITFFIAIVGAGRQSKSTHTTHIDTTTTGDEITGRLGVRIRQSPSRVLEDKEAIAHSSASEEGRKVRRLALAAVLEGPRCQKDPQRKGSRC